tara:strand:- start:30 stop:1913 length:1884 start_codon:yes stop_codon:yes gene_type:complete
MFKKVREWGDHFIYSYEKENNKFMEFFQDLYQSKNLENLFEQSKDFELLKDKVGSLDDRETDLHKKFYSEIKSNDKFKNLYCKFVKDIYDEFFPNEKMMIYQSFPSVRFQFENSTVVPPHCDSDSLGCHPIGEKNFLLPITSMKETSSIYIESKPGLKDFESVNMEYGNLLFFNGNKCIHYNERNKEGNLRISLDFRIVKVEDYKRYVKFDQIMETNPRNADGSSTRCPVKMLIGGYYQISKFNSNLDEMKKWYHDVKNIIMQHRPTFGDEEANATYKYMLEDNFITEHKKTLELENVIKEYLNTSYCHMTTSGTSAIILALMALELNPGDKVIVPNYTMIATVNSIKHLGLEPIILDVDKDTFTLNVDMIKEINQYSEAKPEYSNIKALIHVSLNNRCKKLEELVSFCKEKNIFLIEDSAQSLGCKFNGKSLGTFGDIGCFSLSTPKIISTGQGGFVVTNNENLSNKIKMMKNFGRKESGKDNFESFGINLKFTDLQAVVGLEQMKKLDYRVERLREIYNRYYNNLNYLGIIKEPQTREWIPWFIDIFVDKREELIEFLNKHNIKTRPTYGEINKTKMYYSDETLINSNFVSNKGLFLPSYITISNEQIDYICNIINLFLVTQNSA